jgi:hypothetical protein
VDEWIIILCSDTHEFAVQRYLWKRILFSSSRYIRPLSVSIVFNI